MMTLAVTGGGQGIGRGIAYRFAQAGYAVSIIDGDDKAGREACAHIESLGVQALFMRGDVSLQRDVETFERTDVTEEQRDVAIKIQLAARVLA